MLNRLEGVIAHDQKRSTARIARELLGALVRKNEYVGEVYSIGYEEALVQIHDFHRQQVGGIPSLSFLIATRLNPDPPNSKEDAEEGFDYKAEDTSVLLLRVMDAAPLLTDVEAQRIREESARRVSGESDTHWDDSSVMDAFTNKLLSFAGVKCRVIGTFYLDRDLRSTAEEDLVLRFGSDLSNYYPNRGLKVYKPTETALERIVNYRNPDRDDLPSALSVSLGRVRYASTNRAFQGVSDVPVSIMPADLLGAKSALFGMTRTGKSNTTKIILQSVFNLRHAQDRPLRIGQLVFDPNGEYANENTQDADGKGNPAAIKNVSGVSPNGPGAEVVTYGITSHPNDSGRRMMLIDFFAEPNLQIGKEMIDGVLSGDQSGYLRNFRQVRFGPRPVQDDYPDQNTFRSALTRYNRRVEVYRALLAKAGFEPSIAPATQGLFGQDLRTAMQNSTGRESAAHVGAAMSLARSSLTWHQMANALDGLADFVADARSGYPQFEQTYAAQSTAGDNWADTDLKSLLEMFRYGLGTRLIGQARPHHAAGTTGDYAEVIYEDLVAGRLVIVDQSSGDPELNKTQAQRLMWYVFRQNQLRFTQGERSLPEILVYVEEAHNILPPGKEDDMRDVWVRTAKEGAK